MSSVTPTSDLSNLVSLIVEGTTDLNKKLVNVQAEQNLTSQKNAVVEDALKTTGTNVDLQA